MQAIPGNVSPHFPPLVNLAVEWHIEGDDNQNGTVTVRFREKGKNQWKEAMPLRRVPAGENIGFSWKNKHSGSIFDLEPGTSYEIHLNWLILTEDQLNVLWKPKPDRFRSMMRVLK